MDDPIRLHLPKLDTAAVTCGGWPRGERRYSRDQDVDPNTAGHQGATDGGSGGGSPVVNGSSQILGQLSGACGSNVGNVCDPASTTTVDGVFEFYYSKVQPILNP